MFNQEEFETLFSEALNCKVKVKLETGEIFQFNPYFTVGSGDIFRKECKIDWINSIENTRKTLYVYELRDMINREGVETNNIDDMSKCKYNTMAFKLNTSL
jgi:hypothetical protein